MDPKLARWFDEGSIPEALIGDGIFYIHAPAFEVHDRVFVMEQLSTWTGSVAAREQAAGRGVLDAIDRLLVSGRCDDAVDVLISLLLAAESALHGFPLPRSELEHRLREIESQYASAGRLDAKRRQAIDHVRSGFSMRNPS